MITLVTGTEEELRAAVAMEASKQADAAARLLVLALTHWLIFLDFDGVLNHDEFFSQQTAQRWEAGESFDKACVSRLNKLITVMGAVVVISSSWRHGRSLKDLQEILEAHGFVGTLIGKTPEYVLNEDKLSKRHYGQRGDEIRSWLDALPEKTDRFIVLDDCGGMDAVLGHFVQTNFHQGGLTDAKVEEALRLKSRLSR